MKNLWTAIRRHINPGYETNEEKAKRNALIEQTCNMARGAVLRISEENMRQWAWYSSPQFQGHAWAHQKYWGKK